MAAIAQAVAVDVLVRNVLASVPLPGGVALKSIEIRENSHGEPAIFIGFNVASNGRDEQEQIRALLLLVDRTLKAVDSLNLPLFAYVEFDPR